MKVSYDKGIYITIDGIQIMCDPTGSIRKDVEIVLLSHGHSDHASGLSKVSGQDIVMHPATFEYKRNNIDATNDLKLVRSGEKISYRGLTIEVYRAAHCLGSLQFRIVGKEGVVVFTGDINLSGSYIEPKAPILKCDILIIEANFGHPKYVFPDRMKICKDLASWMMKYKGDKPIVLLSHALGKAQELTQIINDFGIVNGTGHLVMNGLALTSNMIFEKYRYKWQNKYRSYNPSIDLMPGDVLLYPIHERISPQALFELKKKLKLEEAAFAHVSGWTLNQPGSYNFPLSSHSGYDDLMNYAEESGAKIVYTFHGHSDTLAKCINDKGIKSESLTPESTYC